MEDEQILALFSARSQQALHLLEQKYGTACRRLAMRILGCAQDAEECVNDAYFGVWNTIPPAHPNPLAAYVLRIVRNISINRYHSREADKRASAYTVAMEELEPSIRTIETVEGEAGARELVQLVECFLKTLSVQNRVIFMQRYYFCAPYAEIAQKTGLTEKAISVRLTRIRQKLRAYLQEKEVIL